MSRFLTLWWLTTSSSSDDHLNASEVSRLSISITLLLLLVLPTLNFSAVLEVEGLFLPFPPQSAFPVLLQIPSANSTPLTCFIWIFQCLLSRSAYGEHLQLYSTSHMHLPNPVLPYSLQMQSYPQSTNSSPCFLCLLSSPDWQTCLEPLKTLRPKVINRLDWTTHTNSIGRVFESFYYGISKKSRLWCSHASLAINTL